MSYIKKFFIDIFGYYESIMLWSVLAFIVFVIVVLYIIFHKTKEHEKFKSLEFYDVVWKWNWTRKKKIISLWCYCPKCGSELVCDDESCRSSSTLANKTTYFICQNCGDVEKSRIIGGDRKYVLKIVRLEIIKRVNKNSYKNEVAGSNG
ncbi:MAG: hypothetical protein LBS39_01130 [Campylobacteraceae bacterium]|jgi:predicted RNA-binding Zn-ribbon protein involved in translation (DUF1610 family)|nr:hypothetical protein [Campylobacteraceae bacterium]